MPGWWKGIHTTLRTWRAFVRVGVRLPLPAPATCDGIWQTSLSQKQGPIVVWGFESPRVDQAEMAGIGRHAVLKPRCPSRA
jgi:hypothetical protein